MTLPAVLLLLDYWQLGRPEEAVQAYSGALRIDPTCEKARKALADLEEQGIGN